MLLFFLLSLLDDDNVNDDVDGVTANFMICVVEIHKVDTVDYVCMYWSIAGENCLCSLSRDNVCRIRD